MPFFFFPPSVVSQLTSYTYRCCTSVGHGIDHIRSLSLVNSESAFPTHRRTISNTGVFLWEQSLPYNMTCPRTYIRTYRSDPALLMVYTCTSKYIYIGDTLRLFGCCCFVTKTTLPAVVQTSLLCCRYASIVSRLSPTSELLSTIKYGNRAICIPVNLVAPRFLNMLLIDIPVEVSYAIVLLIPVPQ